ncbi:MAG: amylo-alpha-1,6-glucosidase [Brachybacterium faecium]|nr:MAG: amylo-alpha-1,6-glucosidase [Brachybacterium faecium]
MLQPTTEPPRVTHQPYLHDLVGVFRAPFQAWSRPDGTITHPGAEGLYLGDTRVVSGLTIEVDGGMLEALPPLVRSAQEIELRHVLVLPGAVVDPLVELRQVRRAGGDGLTETVSVVSADDRPHSLTVRVRVSPDATGMSTIKNPEVGIGSSGSAPEPTSTEDSSARWDLSTERAHAELRLRTERARPAEARVSVEAGEIVLEAVLSVPAGGGSASFTWAISAEDPSLPFVGPAGSWAEPILAQRVRATADPQQRAVDRLLRASLWDLDSLRMQVPGVPEESFFAAGAPWYFTLFGRDSLIAASLVLPLDVDIAASTLRTLARRQGTTVDIETAEQPGKILHEVRGVGMDMGDSYLPPVYYGTIDATPLWIELLHDAWRAGMDEDQVATLRPHLEAACTWLLEHGDADGDGFLEYIDQSGHGLANQGWKDSGDSVRFADGTIAEGTIALAEVQGYAYAAARHAAELLEHLEGTATGTGAEAAGCPSDLPARLRTWADQLRERFHASYWCRDEDGPYIALALDGTKQRVDGVASNMGHLLGTGLLDAEQERIVVDRLVDPTMFTGYGVRTLSSDNGAYWPLRYHGGSVWTHDTAYILRGILRAGFEAEAAVLARGLLRAASGFEDRLPELFSGEDATTAVRPMPYPASCRPQAWAAASAVPVAQALGGL